MNLFLAPIQGATVAHYRNTYNKIFGGFDAYYAPFIDTTQKNKNEEALFKDIHPDLIDDGTRVIPQLLGNNGSDFKEFAAIIAAMGYDEINWNIGCPYPMVAKKLKGSGLMAYPEKIEAFLDEVCKDSSYDLTIKMRLGYNALEEGHKVIELLNDYPLKGLIIHGRTGIQKYAGVVDLDGFEALYKASKHTITYNGDIYSLNDYNTIQARFPEINNFMLGRGALRNPFLAGEIKGQYVSDEEKIKKIQAFHKSIYTDYKAHLSGDKHLLDRMKEFWSYLSFSIDDDGKFMKKIKKCKTSDAYLSIIDEKFSTLKQLNQFD